MRLAALLLIIAAAGFQAATPASTYAVTKWTGDHDFLFEFRTAAQPVMTPPGDNILSARQKLPFPWKFFGQPVDGYFVSDNGYITFDANAKTSVPLSTTLPDAAAPPNSIFAFWRRFRTGNLPRSRRDSVRPAQRRSTSPERDVPRAGAPACPG